MESGREAEQKDFRDVLVRQIETNTSMEAEREAEQKDFRDVLVRTIGANSSTEAEREAEQMDFRNVLVRHVKTKQRPKVEAELQVRIRKKKYCNNLFWVLNEKQFSFHIAIQASIYLSLIWSLAKNVPFIC